MESNGPDVRIRGTAAHIAEKYAQLANDAQTAGDTVSAQSYWQFAEHYNRLVAAAQAAQQQAREEQQAAREARAERGDRNERSDAEGGDENRREEKGRGRNRGRNRNANNEANAEAGDAEAATDEVVAAETVNGEGPQPVLQDTPAEVALADKPSVSDEGDEDEASAKPKKPRRPRKPKPEAAAAASDDVSGLPAFVTGAE